MNRKGLFNPGYIKKLNLQLNLILKLVSKLKLPTARLVKPAGPVHIYSKTVLKPLDTTFNMAPK